MFEFIGSLGESRLYPTKRHIERCTPREAADMAHAMLCGLRILLAEEESQDWARDYAKATTQYGHFDQWHSSGNDLYIALHALVSGTDMREDPHNRGRDIRNRLPIDKTNLRYWLRGEASGNPSDSLSRRVFLHLDDWFAITDPSLRAIRRIVLDWHRAGYSQRSLAITRLHQILLRHGSMGEVLQQIKRLAARHRLIIPHATDPDKGRDRPYSLIRGMAENASAGATGAASVAGVAAPLGGLGVGFDPKGMEKSIYHKKVAKKPKTPMLRR